MVRQTVKLTKSEKKMPAPTRDPAKTGIATPQPKAAVKVGLPAGKPAPKPA
jgi:hypothetical protein